MSKQLESESLRLFRDAITESEVADLSYVSIDMALAKEIIAALRSDALQNVTPKAGHCLLDVPQRSACANAGYCLRSEAQPHVTDGSPCWCNPFVEEGEGGNVIIHNYNDNWQQYGKPGETAQQIIERHRAEQDALMELLAKERAHPQPVPEGWVLVPVKFLAKRSHYSCDDAWYSCPKSEDGCADEGKGNDCTCGADEWNAKVDAMLAAAPKVPE